MNGALATLARRFLSGLTSPAEDRRLVRALLAESDLLAADPCAPAVDDYAAVLDRVSARLPALETLVLRADRAAVPAARSVERAAIGPRRTEARRAGRWWRRLWSRSQRPELDRPTASAARRG